MSKNILFFLGSFFLIIGVLSFFNIIYSYYFNLYLNVDSYLPTLIISSVIFLILFFIKKKENKFSVFEKILTVICGYIIFPILISLPYYFSIYNVSLIDSYFEAVSGFTSTGFTVFENIRHLDESIIIWRSTSQWIGGLYFLFSIIILIDIFDTNLKKSLTNFISFNSAELIKQSIKVLFLYVFLTILIFFVLSFINFRLFDAFNFSLTIISSGGFKPLNEINLILNNNYKIIVFALTLLIPFFSIFLSYNIFYLKNRNLNFFTEDYYLLYYLIVVTVIFFVFFSENNFIELFLSITSSVSNIGIYLSNYNNKYYLIYLILVIIGGSFFSTSSGIRFFKIFTLIRFSFNEMLSHTNPKQVILNKVIFDNSQINYEVIYKYFLSILIFLISLICISSLLSFGGLNFVESIKIGILTIMNTVNSSLYGLEDFNFNNINIFSKFVFIIFMIIGRVEFITIILIFKKYLFKS